MLSFIPQNMMKLSKILGTGAPKKIFYEWHNVVLLYSWRFSLYGWRIKYISLSLKQPLQLAFSKT
jgi:hypothetical protein